MNLSDDTPCDVFDNFSRSLEYQSITSVDYNRLIDHYPELRNSSDKYCPTCNLVKSYLWKDVWHNCNCENQLIKNRHYLASGIGDLYQRYEWADVTDAAKELKDTARTYLENSGFVTNGMGLMFTAKFGLGKSLVANLLLKSLMWQGHAVYATTFTNMIEMFTSGWKDVDDKRYFSDKLKRSKIVLIDDIGKEMRTSTNLAESTFDDVLRYRVQNNLPTIITTNMTKKQFGSGYGSAVLSLLAESSIIVELTEGEDFRSQAQERKLQEMMSGERRPIF